MASANQHSLHSSASLSSLALPDALLQNLQALSQSLKIGDRAPRHILLYGPSGVGKTAIARTLAAETGIGCLWVGTEDLLGGYVGQSAAKLRGLFQHACGMSPCILMIDEFEGYFPPRGGGDPFRMEIVIELLTQLDRAKVNAPRISLLAVAQQPQKIDPAILSRFTDRIEIANT